MSGAMLPLPNTPSRRGTQLRKTKGQLYFYLYLWAKEVRAFYWTWAFVTVFTKLHYCTLILSEMNPFHTFPPYFSKINFNIILLSSPTSSKWSLSLRLSEKISSYFTSARLTHLILFWFDHLLICIEQNHVWSLNLTKNHAMMAYWGNGGVSTYSLTSALDGGEWSASRPARFNHREKAPGIYWIGGWVGPRAVLDAVMRKIPSSRRESNPRTPIDQPLAQRYTDWAITALLNLLYDIIVIKFKVIWRPCSTAKFI
jgi:hypothetical protein